VYLAFRFQWKFGVGAIASLAHDTVITLGILAFFQIPFDLTVLAAVLAMVGYSLNDTIIIYDRIRENFRVLRKADLIENIDVSVTQTLLRTLATSFSTALALIALLVFGGDTLGNFALTLLIGVVVGTYSSVYIGATVLVWLKLSVEDLIPPVTAEEVDDRP
jgi:preprotein translocase subunit SecF